MILHFLILVYLGGQNLSALASNAVRAEEPSSLDFSGSVQFWIAPIAAETSGLPTAAGAEKPLRQTLTRPAESGGASTVRAEFSDAAGKAILAFFWRRPADGSRDYITTQVELRNSQNLLVALCSLYNFPENSVPLITGACSGRDGDILRGISFHK